MPYYTPYWMFYETTKSIRFNSVDTSIVCINAQEVSHERWIDIGNGFCINERIV